MNHMVDSSTDEENPADADFVPPIHSVRLIESCPPFLDYRWSDKLGELQRLNIVYGANGSGKTTFSSLFSYVEDPSNSVLPEGARAKIRVRDNDGSTRTLDVPADAEEFPPVKVYSTERIERYLGTIDRGSLPANLVLGRGQPELQESLDQAQADLDEKESLLGDAKEHRATARGEMDKKAKAVGKEIKETLAGVPDYLNYNKSHVWSNWDSISGSKEKIPSSDVEKYRRRATEPPGEELPPAPDLLNIEPLVDDLKALGPMPDASAEVDPRHRDWITKGLALHRDTDQTHECIYCTNTISRSRQQLLRDLERDAQGKYRRKVQNLIDGSKQLKSEVEAISFPDSSEVRDVVKERYATSKAKLEEAHDSLVDWLDQTISILQDALAGEREEISLPLIEPNEWRDRCSDFNQVILEHNQAVRDHDAERRKWARKYTNALEVNAWIELEESRETVQQKKGEVQGLEDEVAELKAKVQSLAAKRVTPTISAEQLTRDLSSYFGRDDFEIRSDPEDEKMYQLLRHGEPVHRLSDGERLAISFVYFLETLREHGFDAGEAVVVIDDPVSSMDEQSIYYAHHFLRERARGVSQVIVLTHNFPFFRLLRYDALNRKKDSSKLMMIEAEGDPRSAELVPLHPFLREFESDYHYLFYKVWEVANREGENGDGGSDLQDYLAMPNQARRLVEAFGSFVYPGHEDLSAGSTLDAIAESIGNDAPYPVQQAGEAAGAIKAFLNYGSHQVGVAGHDPDPAVLHDCPSYMKHLLALMEFVSQRHVRGMKRKCRRARRNEEFGTE